MISEATRMIGLCGSLAAAGVTSAGFVEFENDQAGWLAAAGVPTTIDFVLPESAFLTDQYEHLGVSFPQGNDVAFPWTGFLTDGWGVEGSPFTFGDMIVQWDQPLYAIGCDFAGLLKLELYSGDTLLYTSTILGVTGLGQFGGIVSTVPFDRVRIWDPSDNGFALDNIHFVSVPAPAVAALLALAGWTPRRRRR